jgi:hydrogenase maturation protein HypF
MISARFHETLAVIVDDMCRRLRDASGLDRVVLSGGVFQNIRLLSRCMELLAESGFKVFIHSRVPANDGGISLGQAVIAMVKSSTIC